MVRRVFSLNGRLFSGLPDYKISQTIAQSACLSLTCSDKIMKLMKKKFQTPGSRLSCYNQSEMRFRVIMSHTPMNHHPRQPQ